MQKENKPDVVFSKPNTARYTIILGIAWIAFSIILGLFFMFDQLERSSQVTAAMTYGSKILLITLFSGCGIVLVYLKLTSRFLSK